MKCLQALIVRYFWW